ncbi:MAG: PilT/PilU family type 4a pilus ATPase [Pseudomonadota bacterium]|nr:PilT/PilU family type 4a pilus ATPase [Pseudomonadota bacterium]
MKKFNDIILTGVKEGFSDIHMTGNQPLVYRHNGVIRTDRSIRWTYQEIDQIVSSLLNPFNMQILRKRWSVDFSISIQHARVRINVFNTTTGLSLSIRLLPGLVPTIDLLNLHPSLGQIGELKSGLVLICGTTGSGKTTTIAAIIEEINRSRSAHVVTIEDPVEFRFVSKQSFIQQREVGAHVSSFRQGLLDVLRQDPDVIFVGELREPETIRLTLSAAESGHLVIASIHAAQVEDAIYRICNSFPLDAQDEIRFQLASSLAWVVVQQLLYIERLRFRVPVLSILRGVQSVKGLIRENRLPQLENAMHTGRTEGMFTRERYMNEFVNLKKGFVLPSQSFRPAPEAFADEEYASPLIGRADYGVAASAAPSSAPSVPSRSALAPAGETGRVTFDQAPLRGFSDDESHYVIDEGERLEDIIAQLDK